MSNISKDRKKPYVEKFPNDERNIYYLIKAKYKIIKCIKLYRDFFVILIDQSVFMRLSCNRSVTLLTFYRQTSMQYLKFLNRHKVV